MSEALSKRLNVRLASAEHEALAQRAKASDLSISDYVRFCCLKENDRPRIIVDMQVLKRLYSDQRRIGGLLNQLLRHANTRHQDFPELADQAQDTLNQFRETNRLITNFITDVYTSL